MKTSISFLKSKYDNVETIKRLCQTDTDMIHVDIMDGKFVKNKSLSVKECLELFKNCDKKLDIHLMVKYPIDYLDSLKKLNVKNFTIHVELGHDIKTYINLIHSYGIKAGLAINPKTNVRELYPYLDMIDYIIVMGVEPGAGGQQLIPETVDKVKELKQKKNAFKYKYDIALDGGINKNTIVKLRDLDVAISGSFVCMSDDYQAAIDILR